MNDRVAIPVWSIGSFLVIMNTTMFNVSLPSILYQLHITAATGSWIVSGYSIVYALATIIYSRLSDFIPIRTLLSIGLFLLGIASIAGYIAHSFGILLAARLLQASGAGSVPALGMVLASRYVPYERRGRAISIIASGVSLGFGLGPVIGGSITEYFGWNELFLVTLLVIPLVPVLRKLLPQEGTKEFNFDTVGAGFTVATITTLLAAVTQESSILLLVSMVLLAIAIRHMKSVKVPFIQPVLFYNPGYRKLICIAFCSFVLNMSMLFLMPLLLANVFHKEAATIGIIIFPGAMLSVLLLRLIGRWIDEYGNIRFLLLGHILLLVAMIFMTLMIRVSPYIILIGYMIFSPSLSALTSSLSNEVSRILAKEHIGAGMGLAQLFQFFGGSFAVAVCGILLDWQKNLPVIETFQHTYLLLISVLLGSFLLLILYIKANLTRPHVSSVVQDGL